MRLVVSSEHRFYRSADGLVWTDGQGPYQFWTRYLDVFDQVEILARVAPTATVDGGWREATGPGVSFTCVPYYVGPWQYLKKHRAVKRTVRTAADRADALLLRVGSHIAGCIEPDLRKSGRPYAVEVVSDPSEVFARGVIDHPLRPWLRRHFTALQRRLCANACAAAYVTERTLQRRYPCAGMQVDASDVELGQPNVYSTHFSSIDLVDADYANVRRSAAEPPHRLITVGSLAQPYKGVDVLIDAIALCAHRGMDVTLTIVGDGRLRPTLEARARSQGVSHRVRFVGSLPSGAGVQQQLDLADLFVLASRTEGLPRAMIEAMARALPCIGSDVGGIPELLPPEDMVKPGDSRRLAAKIAEVFGTPGRLGRMSLRSISVARGYHTTELHARRRAFYEYLRDRTHEWQRRRAAGESVASMSGRRLTSGEA